MNDDRSLPVSDQAQVLSLIEDYLAAYATDTHRLLGDVAGVAVTMADHEGRPLTIGASADLARSVDELQYRLGDGPCLNALRGNGGDYVRSLAEDDRWGPYGPEAAALGAKSCLSVPVEAGDTVVAVFKVYSGVEDGLTEQQRRRGAEAAREVAGGIGLARSLARVSTELTDRAAAMDSRRTIDLALGILMERAGCGADEAFGLLRRYSQTRNVKLRDVAAEIVAGSQGGPGAGAAPFLSRGSAPAL